VKQVWRVSAVDAKERTGALAGMVLVVTWEECGNYFNALHRVMYRRVIQCCKGQIKNVVSRANGECRTREEAVEGGVVYTTVGGSPNLETSFREGMAKSSLAN
jgi:hypothetical protein